MPMLNLCFFKKIVAERGNDHRAQRPGCRLILVRLVTFLRLFEAGYTRFELRAGLPPYYAM